MRKSLAKLFIILLIFITCVCTCFSCSQSKIKIEFVVDGEVYHTLELEDDVVILFPEKPEKEGYVFLGWYFDSRGESDILKSDYLLKNDSVGNKIKVYAIFERDREVHLHHYVATVVPPTCESVGYTEYACSCNDKYREDEVPKKGHKFENYIYNNDSSCEVNGTESAVCANGCGEINTRIKENSALAHSFTEYTSNHDATYDSDGTKTAYCDNGCGKTSTVVDEGSKLIPGHVHEYDREVVLDIYKVRSATCVSKATYNKSCECGARGDEIFETGDLLPHNYENYLFDNNATCDVDGTKTAYCTMGCGESDVKIVVGSRLGHKFENYIYNNNALCEVNGTESAVCANGCGEIDRREKENSALTHSFTKYTSNHDATYDSDGTKTANCDNGCGKTSTVVDEGSKLVYSAIEFKSLKKTDDGYEGEFDNSVTVFDFLQEIEIIGNATYALSSDIEGSLIFNYKKVNLSEGQNVFYVFDYSRGEVERIKVSLYRKIMVEVTFVYDSTLKTQVYCQEGEVIVPPTLEPQKQGYTFNGWGYDFSLPIDRTPITIHPTWTPNVYSYTVTYYFENSAGTYTKDNSLTKTYQAKVGDFVCVSDTDLLTDIGEHSLDKSKSTLSATMGISGNLELRLLYVYKSYTVIFNANGGRLKYGELVQSVQYGESVEEPTVEMYGYTLSWDRDISSVKESCTINAVWTPRTFSAHVFFNDKQMTEDPVEMTFGKEMVFPNYDENYPLVLVGYEIVGYDEGVQRKIVQNGDVCDLIVDQIYLIYRTPIDFQDGFFYGLTEYGAQNCVELFLNQKCYQLDKPFQKENAQSVESIYSISGGYENAILKKIVLPNTLRWIEIYEDEHIESLCEIVYDGTIAQFKSIDAWRRLARVHCSVEYIQCKDGRVTFEEIYQEYEEFPF